MSRVALFLERLREPLEGEDSLLRLRTQWLEELSPDEIIELLDGLAALASACHPIRSQETNVEDESSNSSRQVWQQLLPVVLEGVLRAVQRQGAKLRMSPVVTPFVNAVVACHEALASELDERSTLLEMLTLLASPASLRQFAELVVTQPPADGMKLDRAFARLFDKRIQGIEALYPRLLDGLTQPGLATAVLDLANFLTRESVCQVHPGASRVDELIDLLGGLVARLVKLEHQAPDAPDEVGKIRDQVADGVGLGVALCDALGLIGDEKAVPKLNQASELTHRRLRVEAFAALARLHDERGQQELLALIREPATRLRAVTYARELGLADQIDPSLVTAEAMAEAELAAWLSEPRQFGLPPQSIELFDQRTLSWPGFNDPVECFLFRFEYQAGQATYANMGLTGPITHAFLPDLTDLPPLDIYAAFAGWQTTHHDIMELSVENLDPSRQTDFKNLEQQLSTLGFRTHQWRFLGCFFGEHVFVGSAIKDELDGALALSMFDHAWFPARIQGRSIDEDLAFSIWKGRRFLKQFNPAETFAVGDEDEHDSSD